MIFKKSPWVAIHGTIMRNRSASNGGLSGGHLPLSCLYCPTDTKKFFNLLYIKNMSLPLQYTKTIHYMIKKKHFYAKDIKAGSVVSIYGEDWVNSGPIKIYDGDTELHRIMFSSLRSPCVYTFVDPLHRFDFYQGTYSDCEDLPF